jgi:uncharacterized protein related to proFAR isomerase
MDFIFMLTHGDKTVPNCLEVFDSIKDYGVKHVGFKDIGVDLPTLKTLCGRIKDSGAVAYMEVVSTTTDSARRSIQAAADIGVDRVLGGNEVDFALEVLGGSGPEYYPFPGRPVGHPTSLEGSPEDIAGDCRAMMSRGCAGADLLAYRATQADPMDLIHAARKALGDGHLIIAGSISSPRRIRKLADAGVDAFTIGTAIFDHTVSPGKNSIGAQIEDALAACS